MNKRVVIPIIVVCFLIVIIAVSTCGGSNKITLSWNKIEVPTPPKDKVNLKVYVENSGSMDGYMCPGSNLKDAVFDYVSDLKKYSASCSLNYINSQTIPYHGGLEAFIKDLTPASFAKAGGNRANTDLRSIFKQILAAHQGKNTITVFVSDCVLDIPESATDFFGNCQVFIKNVFNEALSKNPNLGVEVIKMESKFDGWWYCGKNKMLLKNAKRPYYIWVIGDKAELAELNKKVPVNDIIGGISGYCAYSGASPIPFDMNKTTFVVGHTEKISVQILVDLTRSLQGEDVITNVAQYQSSNPLQIKVSSARKITDPASIYSHVIEIEMSSPKTLKSETLTFSYPAIPQWVVSTNDSTGKTIKGNIGKTTGLAALVKGVADAYKPSMEYGSVSFNLKNK